jgi:hypothetical protein
MKPEDEIDTSELTESLTKLQRKIKRWDELTGARPKLDKAAIAPEPPPEPPAVTDGDQQVSEG